MMSTCKKRSPGRQSPPEGPVWDIRVASNSECCHLRIIYLDASQVQFIMTRLLRQEQRLWVNGNQYWRFGAGLLEEWFNAALMMMFGFILYRSLRQTSEG